jgi:hypothetical protein
MAKRSYDENKCLSSISKVTQIDYSSKTIIGHPDVNIGIRRLGKIDYLCNYCGWIFYWNHNACIGRNYDINTEKVSARQIKKKKGNNQN